MNDATQVGTIPAIFLSICPNCGGEITSDRLTLGLPCDACLPYIPKDNSIDSIVSALSASGNLKRFRDIYEIERKAKDFSDFFKSVLGFEPWSLQVAWSKRVISGQSFVALAPTGVGKTTFGMVMALFLDGKSYIIMPTKLLSKLFTKKLLSTIDGAGGKITKKILLVDRSGEKIKREVEAGDYDILITTSMFLARNEKLLEGKKFDFIFVDDVDSYLRQPKNVERVLKLMGLSTDDINSLKEIMMRKYSVIRDRQKSQNEKIDEFSKISMDVEKIRRNLRGVLVVSSATAKARAGTIRYFRELFGFEISPQTTALRNIEDTFIGFGDKGEVTKAKGDVFHRVFEVVKRCGKGAFIFVNSEYGKPAVQELKDFLVSRGIPACTYEEFGDAEQDSFRRGEIQAVIGISSLRNPLCRGIDLPDAVRYTVFAGVPRFIFSMGDIDEPAKMLGVLISLRPILGKKAFSFIESMRKYSGMRAEDIQRYPAIIDRIESIKKFIKDTLSDPQILAKIKESEDVPLRVVEGDNGVNKFRFVVADSSAYIQASGRASRLYIGGLSKGLSVVVVDDPKAFSQLKKRLRLDILDITFKPFDEVNIDGILKKIDEDREKIRLILAEGEDFIRVREGDFYHSSLHSGSASDFIKPPKSAVLIVESPNKARTIANLLGKPTRRKVRVNGSSQDVWEVSRGDLNITILASGGHMFDLPFTYQGRGLNGKDYYAVQIRGGKVFIPMYMEIRRCRVCGENFFGEGICPYCGSKDFESKSNVFEVIRRVCLEADEIFIATDPDHEGEKIAWDIFLSIPKYGKDIKRAEYHEVTKKAILGALSSPRDINLDLVKAQIVRRITDRWIGFVMSEELQKKFDKIWLSAGRVQTPVLGWLIKREEEMKKKVGLLKFNGDFGISDFIRIDDPAEAKGVGKLIRKLRGRRRKNEEDEKRRIENSKINVSFELLETYEVELDPPPPLNTADMLKEASGRLKFSAPETMALAQQLFESGLITYHRTDSYHVSDVGISVAKEYIFETMGEDFFRPRSWAQEGTHECIRPSRNLSPDELRISARIGNISVSEKAISLYEIIFGRFIASQMRRCGVLKGKIKVRASFQVNDIFKELSKESEINLKIIEDGWNKALFLPIPNFAKYLLDKKKIEFETGDFSYSFVSPVPPYTQGTLIDEMRKRGIGRPSTWAYIVKTLLDRGYCIERGGYLIITSLGKQVYEYLSNHKDFAIYTSEDYTRQLEEKMDKVERREESYVNILHELFTKLYPFFQSRIQAK